MKSCSLPRALAFGCVAAAAVSISASAADKPTQLQPVVVTATRTAQTVDETLASVTVISRDDIERQQARSVEDLLRGIEGISIANSGGPGKLTSVFMRGASSSQLLVLIDGIKTGSPTSGMMAFQDLPVELIDRIDSIGRYGSVRRRHAGALLDCALRMRQRRSRICSGR